MRDQIEARYPKCQPAYLRSAISHRRRNSPVNCVRVGLKTRITWPKQIIHGVVRARLSLARGQRMRFTSDETQKGSARGAAPSRPAVAFRRPRRSIARSVCGDDAERPSASTQTEEHICFHTILLGCT